MALATLDIRPIKLEGLSFAKSLLKRALIPRQHANLFRLNHNLYNIRHRSEVFTNRLNIWRYFKSPVIYLTRILNNEEESWNITDCNYWTMDTKLHLLCALSVCIRQYCLYFTNTGSKPDYVYYYYSDNVIKLIIVLMQ